MEYLIKPSTNSFTWMLELSTSIWSPSSNYINKCHYHFFYIKSHSLLNHIWIFHMLTKCRKGMLIHTATPTKFCINSWTSLLPVKTKLLFAQTHSNMHALHKLLRWAIKFSSTSPSRPHSKSSTWSSVLPGKEK